MRPIEARARIFHAVVAELSGRNHKRLASPQLDAPSAEIWRPALRCSPKENRRTNRLPSNGNSPLSASPTPRAKSRRPATDRTAREAASKMTYRAASTPTAESLPPLFAGKIDDFAARRPQAQVHVAVHFPLVSAPSAFGGGFGQIFSILHGQNGLYPRKISQQNPRRPDKIRLQTDGKTRGVAGGFPIRPASK